MKSSFSIGDSGPERLPFRRATKVMLQADGKERLPAILVTTAWIVLPSMAILASFHCRPRRHGLHPAPSG